VKLTDITPEEWANLRRWWFGSVYEVADMEFQRRTWLTPPTPSQHWSMCSFVAHIRMPANSNPREIVDI
jgi:hypothetical protein